MKIIIIFFTFFFILFDEFIMALSQHRTGPYIGFYGLISPLVNAFNLFIATVQFPKTHFYVYFTSFATLFLMVSLSVCLQGFPLFIVDLYLTILILILLSSISILFLIFSSFSASSKYSILGSLRIASQLISFHLILSTIFILLFSMYDSLSFGFYFYCSWNMCCV